MKKLIPVLIVFTILLAPGVLASPLEISISPKTASVDAWDTVIYTLSVRNNLETPEEFLITHSGDHLEWKFPGTPLLLVEAGATAETKIAFTPGKTEGTHQFTVTVASDSASASENYTMDVSIPPVVTLEGLDLVKEGRYLQAELEIRAREPTDVSVLLELKDGSGQTVSSWTESGSFYRTSGISMEISLADLPQGQYTLEASYQDERVSEEFSIEAVHDISETTEKVSNILYEEVTIEVFNNGNAVETSYQVTALIPVGDFITGFSIQPESCTDQEGGQLCTFLIPEILPGERETVIYRLDFWPSYTKIAASVLIILVFLAFYMLWVSRPKIKKTYRRKGTHEHHVIIDIKAPRHRGLKSTIIRDWVSPLAQVIQQEFRHAKPILRKSEAGTELIWKLGDLAAKEERILSYKIKTMVQGNLKMPRAYIRYSDKKGNRVRVFSGRGVII